jgi:RHS repeat-associated protein
VARDQFWYDTDDQRVQSLESWDESGTPRTRRVLYLGGDVEEVRAPATATHDRIVRLQVTAAVRAIARRRASDQVWEAWYFEYAHRDHLGSVDVITNSAGVVQQKTSFDPYGGRRSTTWNADLPATGLDALRDWQDSRGSRGFTDHEHLNRTGFVHMNGRVYDPRIGRFVSPDPLVSNPGFSQSYNRYAYVLGSPLSYTDPTGYDPNDPDVKLNANSWRQLTGGANFSWFPGDSFSGIIPGGGVLMAVYRETTTHWQTASMNSNGVLIDVAIPFQEHRYRFERVSGNGSWTGGMSMISGGSNIVGNAGGIPGFSGPAGSAGTMPTELGDAIRLLEDPDKAGAIAQARRNAQAAHNLASPSEQNRPMGVVVAESTTGLALVPRATANFDATQGFGPTRGGAFGGRGPVPNAILIVAVPGRWDRLENIANGDTGGLYVAGPKRLGVPMFVYGPEQRGLIIVPSGNVYLMPR